MMRIRTVKPQIILIACLVIIHYLSAPSTREGESVCAVCTVCVCAVCVFTVCERVCLCVGQPARHTQAAVYTDMKLLPNGTVSLSLPLTLPACLSLSPSHSLFFITSVSFFLALALSVSLSHLISENKY